MDYKALTGAFLAGSALTAIACTLYSRAHAPTGPANSTNPNPKPILSAEDYMRDKEYVELKHEQLARVVKFFGEEKFEKMENSYVVVFGVGGVGSHVVNMLARSGVRRIRIVDFDRVSLSSLNRHSYALQEDVGTSKVQCIKKYVNRIFPHILIETVEAYATVENVRELLSLERNPDYVIDCIDNLDAKVELICACVERKLRLMVSGGAGMKNDPTKLQIRDISDCKYDKLIMRIKRELTKRGIKSGVKVAYSYQQAEKELLPLNEVQEDNPHAFKVFDNYRIRIVPVLGTMPAILGMTIASYVLCELADEPYQPFETDYVKNNAISKVYNELLYDEKRRGVSIEEMEVDIEEVSIIAKKAFEWKCLISDKKAVGPRLVRWDPSKPASIDNIALMGKN